MTSILSPRRLDRLERILMMLGSLGIVAIMVIAVWLTPDPKGFGTHQQLGLPECSFRRMTGWNCPHCGMTTSFCWFVRGEWKKSCDSNTAGLLLAVVSVGLCPWLAAMSVVGRGLGIQNPGRVAFYGIAGWLLLSLLLWISRLG